MIRLADIKALPREKALEYLAAADEQTVSSQVAAYVMGASAYGLVISAKNGHLSLPHFFSGNRLKISKAGLLAFCGYKEGAA